MRSTVEDYRFLDVNRWVREGIVREGSWNRGSWAWLRDGERVASIGYEARTDFDSPYVRLYYKVNDTERIDYRVPLTKTYPHFGGVRWWFICPGSGCARRVGKLYGGRYFLCRHCHDLRYQSQRETDDDRLLRKARKIRMRLGGSASLADPFPWKPKGMHQRTYDRLRLKALITEDRMWGLTAARFGLI